MCTVYNKNLNMPTVAIKICLEGTYNQMALKNIGLLWIVK